MLNPAIKSHRQILLETYGEFRNILTIQSIKDAQYRIGLRTLRSNHHKCLVALELLETFGTPKELQQRSHEEMNTYEVMEEPKQEYPASKTLQLLHKSPLFRLFSCPYTETQVRINVKQLLVKHHPDVGGNQEIYAEISRIGKRLIDSFPELISLPHTNPKVTRIANVDDSELPEMLIPLLQDND